MPKSRPARFVFALVALACLFVIGRNVYRQHLDSALAAALEAADAQAALSLLDRGADPNYHVSDVTKSPLLFHAISMTGNSPMADNARKIARLLIIKGADIRSAHAAKYRYLALACQKGDVAVLRCLLEHGADPNQHASARDDPLQATLLYPAVYSASLSTAEQARQQQTRGQMARLLRAYGAHVTLEQAAKTGDADTLKGMLDADTTHSLRADMQAALYTAAEQGDLAIINSLLAHGADVNASGKTGSALNAAAGNGKLEAVKLLLAHGAKVSSDDPSVTSPLTTAIRGKHADAARLLLAQGAGVNEIGASRDNVFRHTSDTTPLTSAISSLPQLVPDLLARGADVHANHDEALNNAIAWRRPDIVRELLRRGARLRTPGPLAHPLSVYAPSGAEPVRTTTPSSLEQAVVYAPECFDMLLQAGANITPDKPQILLAAAHGRAELIPRLIALGANVNASDAQGDTVLTQAIAHAPAAAQTLLEHGANPNVTTRAQRSPLDMAAAMGGMEIARLLLAHGAQVNAHSPRGHTALYYAVRHKNAAMIALLKQAGATKDE